MPTEQAELAFESIARQDDAETEMIVDSVVRQDYRCTHWKFRRRLMGLLNLGKYYGLIYWKNRTYMSAALCQAKENNDKEAQATAFELLDVLLAMDVALAHVCAIRLTLT
ncbi:hypothetical protein [Methyloglobulus sp.]|uniref:hypothetical protein n=1 Tax=Methyloglobulus sp. TaxID=2518622 RepID=UPI003988B5C7